MAQGNCNNHPPSVFFPSDGVGVEAAKKICASCPVKESCLDHALDMRIDHGVWGGASERQRRRILKSRRIAARAAATPVELTDTADDVASGDDIQIFPVIAR